MEQEGKQFKEGTRAPKASAILKDIFAIFGGLVALISALYGASSYIDSRIDSRVNNPDFLKRLARSVRPSLVFDEKGSIISDMGAVAFVSNISVTKEPKDTLTIVVSPVEYFGVEPVLEALDDRYAISAKRGQNYDWIFHLSGIQTFLLESSAEVERHRFRLEIIR